MRAVLLLALLAAASSGDESAEELRDEVMREVIGEGRGARDAEGKRAEWASTEHLKVKYDSRKAITSRVARILQINGVECDGCTNSEALRKLAAHRDERRARGEAEARAQVPVARRRLFSLPLSMTPTPAHTNTHPTAHNSNNVTTTRDATRALLLFTARRSRPPRF